MRGWISAGIAILLFLALPFAIVAAKGSIRGKGRLAGATFAIGIAFAAIFDPAKAAAIEMVQKKSEIGDADEHESAGTPPPQDGSMPTR